MKSINKLFIAFLIVSLVFSSIPHASAMFQASIIPPQPYTVYVGQSYTLKVSVQYDIPKDADYQIGPIELWVFSSPYSSSKVQLVGKGTYSFSLPLTAPSQEGTYTLGIKLYVNSDIHTNKVYDTATVSYQVITPTVNDWAVTKVWITPDSPSPGDDVTFHATIALKSTTGKGTQMAAVGCFLNDRPFGKTQLLSFQYTTSQDIQAPLKWTAEEGSYRLRFAVEDFNHYKDSFLGDNIRDFVFSVEPFFAIVNRIMPIDNFAYSGESFDIDVWVGYFFPESALLKISIIFPFPAGNRTYPLNITASELLNVSIADQTLDNVSRSGNSTYTFTLNAPSIPFSTDPNASETRIGVAKVEFDRGEGSGWEYTDPGFADDFRLFISPHSYYAIISISDVTYLGEVSPFDPNAPRGRFRANIEVEYLLPEEDAKLRVMLTESEGTKIYDGTSGAKGEGKRTYPIEFELPIDEELIKARDYFKKVESGDSEDSFFDVYGVYPPLEERAFDVRILYSVDGEWYSGDAESKSTDVQLSMKSIETVEGRSPFAPVTDFFDAIADFFKGLFGLQNPWAY